MNKELQDKEALYCKLMRQAFEVALKDREKSNALNNQALELKKEIEILRSKILA